MGGQGDGSKTGDGSLSSDLTERLTKYTESGSSHSFSKTYSYDGSNRLTGSTEKLNGNTRNITYTYDDDNRVTTYKKGNVSQNYTYDGFGRNTQKVVKNGSTTLLTTTNTFRTVSGNPTGQVATLKNQAANYNVTYTYTYDSNGNILTVSDGTYTTSYEYDESNQLVRENNQASGVTYIWTYDNAGNIVQRNVRAYSTDGLGEPYDSLVYSYGDSQWGDLLTFGENAHTYDEIGNTLSDGKRTYTWKHGRQLATLTQNGKTWTNSYNIDGLRTKRTDGTNTYQYTYSEGKLISMTYNSDKLYFSYTPDGLPYNVEYNGTQYVYALNQMGDVVAILNTAGEAVVEYTYDAWGNILDIEGSMASTLGQFNPLRYRGYVYDEETGLYYLQSRYYDPEIGRFINADGFVSTGQGILGNNMYAYCGNNPVKNIDPSGACYYGADGKWYHDNWEYIGGYERKPDPGYYQGTTPSGLDVYIAPTTNYSTPPNAVKVVDARDSVDSDGKPNPDIQVRNSYKYTKRTDQIGILALIDKYNILNPSLNKWNRTQSSLFIEWDLHNHLYSLFELDNFKHADLDQNDEHLIINLFNRLLN